MRNIIIAAALLAGSLTGTAANALPVGHVKTATPPTVVSVDWACGRGWHLNRWGECRPSRWRPPPRRYGWDRPHRWYQEHPRRHHWHEQSRRERRWRDW